MNYDDLLSRMPSEGRTLKVSYQVACMHCIINYTPLEEIVEK